MPGTRRQSAADERQEVYPQLLAFDALEVGPLELTTRRIRCPYTVVLPDGQRESTLLSFRWEEDVFDPDDAASRNLAAMVAAQPALNYGLFARRLVFRDAFDETDRRFLDDMARNTAREIVVKKFLEPNPFLVGAAADLPVVKRRNYLRAQLVFDGPTPPGSQPQWPTRPDRYVLLSSGGKESLLSYGLLTEMNCEVSPVYINESGRHWFTALNGYRYHTEAEPRTARVWTDVDRLFAWMLRHLPFIRQDFQNVRSDEYPIRLWTVAILIFGSLPLARKRGCGRVVVGDEYDTTRRASFRGIPHYDGLYDQSRYFDNALSRYYRRKGWQMSQFSLLRPLSELLVETVLVRRYPHLQEHQLSCHAAHDDGGRIYPCGRCEKCRRVVGMLTAMDADPTRCGYSPAQIEECLQALASRSVHQEKEAAGHMLHLLAKKGLVPAGDAPPKAHREAMRLRFDAERSPADWLPRDLRRQLYPIFLEYAQGALVRQGRQWVETDPLSAAFLHPPFRFETTFADETSHAPGSEYLLAELSWPDAKRRLAEVDVALLPVGSIEQHGPHLPLDTDAFDAQYTAVEVARRCSEPRPLVLPAIPYGVSYHHEEFPGTLAIGPDTLSRMVYEVGMAAARQGISKLVILNGHGGNVAALNFAAQMVNRDARIFTCVESGETADREIAALADTEEDVHAGEIETSTSLATRPHLVHMDRAEPFVPRFSSRYLQFSGNSRVEWHARISRISPTGVLGDPTRATAEKGRQMWDLMIRHLVRFVDEIKALSLDEIHRHRF